MNRLGQRMQRIAMVCVALSGVVCVGIGSEEQRQLADGLYKRGLHEMAITEYDRLLKEVPDYGDKHVVWFRLAEAHRQLDSRHQALGYYNQLAASKTVSDYQHRAYLRKAQLLIESKHVGPAIETLEKLLAKSKVDPALRAGAWYYLGSARKGNGDIDGAEAAFLLLIKEHPDSAYVAYAGVEAGRMMQARKADAAEVAAVYGAAAQAATQPALAAEALWSWAYVLNRKGDHAEAITVFERLFTEQATSAQASKARLPYAWSLLGLKEHAQALEVARTWGAKDAATNGASWGYLRANAERQMKLMDEALESYRTVISSYPEAPIVGAARYEAALVAGELNAHEAVVALAGPLIERKDTPADALWLIGDAYRKMKQPEKAIALYEELISRNPGADLAAAARFTLAQLHQTGGAHEKAIALFVEVGTRYVSYEHAPNAWFGAAYSAAQLKQLEVAQGHWATLVEQFPKHELADEALYQWGIAALNADLINDARGALERLVSGYAASPFLSEARFWLATLSEKESDPKAAREQFEALLKEKDVPPELGDKARYRLAVLCQQAGDDTRAAGLIDELVAGKTALKIEPTLLQWAAVALLDQGSPAAAIRVGRVVLADADAPAGSRQEAGFIAGKAAVSTDRRQEAESLWREVMALPEATRARAETGVALGALLSAKTDYKGAQKFYEEGGRSAAANNMLDIQARAYRGLGENAEAAGDLAEANRYFRSVAVLFDHPEITPACLADVVRLATKLGKSQDAAQAQKELKERYPNYSGTQE